MKLSSFALPLLLRAARLGLGAAAILGGLAPGARGATNPVQDAGSANSRRVVLESDGWHLAGTWRPAKDRGPGVLLLHRAAGRRGEYDAFAEALGRLGIASLALDLRGHGESTNLGRFEPPYPEHLHINADAHRDVAVGLRWLSDRGLAPLAVVAASYSGEAAARAGRELGARAAVYLMLSPGDFSADSIGDVSSGVSCWSFVRTQEESPAALEYIDALHAELDRSAPNAQQLILPGAGHATRILELRPAFTAELAARLASEIERCGAPVARGDARPLALRPRRRRPLATRVARPWTAPGWSEPSARLGQTRPARSPERHPIGRGATCRGDVPDLTGARRNR